jgi:hypothetical protein
MQSARPVQSRAHLASGLHTGNLVAKPKKPEPPWPDGSPYVEPAQLAFAFMAEL